MELTKNDEAAAISRPEEMQPDIRELGDLQLALVGGGIGNVILG